MEPSPSPLDGGAEGVDLPPDSLGAEDFAPFNGGAGDNVANDAQLMRQVSARGVLGRRERNGERGVFGLERGGLRGNK